MALEEYIKQVKETWTNYTLDLVNYQNKCRLIRYACVSLYTVSIDSGCLLSGWDDLFNKCSENLNSLVAMKLSPYYKGHFPGVFLVFLVLRPLCSIRGRGIPALSTSGIIVDAFLRRALGKKNSIGYTSFLVRPSNLPSIMELR
jgi:Dynein heavy chain, N-terminal region 2